MGSVTLPLDKILSVYYEWRSIAFKHGIKWYGGGLNLIPTQLWAVYAVDNNEAVKDAATAEMLRKRVGQYQQSME